MNTRHPIAAIAVALLAAATPVEASEDLIFILVRDQESQRHISIYDGTEPCEVARKEFESSYGLNVQCHQLSTELATVSNYPEIHKDYQLPDRLKITVMTQQVISYPPVLRLQAPASDPVPVPGSTYATPSPGGDAGPSDQGEKAVQREPRNESGCRVSYITGRTRCTGGATRTRGILHKGANVFRIIRGLATQVLASPILLAP